MTLQLSFIRETISLPDPLDLCIFFWLLQEQVQESIKGKVLQLSDQKIKTFISTVCKNLKKHFNMAFLIVKYWYHLIKVTFFTDDIITNLVLPFLYMIHCNERKQWNVQETGSLMLCCWIRNFCYTTCGIFYRLLKLSIYE